jgi:hypothetical protein
VPPVEPVVVGEEHEMIHARRTAPRLRGLEEGAGDAHPATLRRDHHVEETEDPLRTRRTAHHSMHDREVPHEDLTLPGEEPSVRQLLEVAASMEGVGEVRERCREERPELGIERRVHCQFVDPVQGQVRPELRHGNPFRGGRGVGGERPRPARFRL